MSVWSSSQALAGLLGCTDPSEGAENLPGCEASVQVLVVGHSREQVADAACDSQDNLIFVASAQLLVRKDNRVENNNLSRNGDTAAWGENAKGLAGGGEAASVERGQGHSTQQRHTQDCDGWCEAPISEKGLTVDLGIGIVGVGVAGCSFNPGPAPNRAVPAHNGIEDTGVVLG